MRFSIPAWLGSLLLHLFGLIFIMVFIRMHPEIRGAPGIYQAENVGIVLKSGDVHDTIYSDDSDIFVSSDGKSSDESVSADINDILQQTNSSFNPENLLPKPLEYVIGSGVSSEATEQTVNQIISASNTSLGGVGNGTGLSAPATVKVFNMQGTGHTFAFVFDRSMSMNELGGKPIRAAKAELIKSISSLQEVHRLLIVFYNETQTVFPNRESSKTMSYATDICKETATRFIQSVVPSGGTNHTDALILAGRYKPDVIFLLTDGEERDDLSPGQMQAIETYTSGIQVNVIQFGLGNERMNRNNLKNLAAKSGGQYSFINIAEWGN